MHPDRLRHRRGGDVAVALLFAALATPVVADQHDDDVLRLGSLRPDSRIVLMHPDIRMFVVNTRGTPKYRDDWSDDAQGSFLDAISAYVSNRAMGLTIGAAASASDSDMVRYERLYTAVAQTILTHYVGKAQLPTKGTTFDWSLGPDVATLGKRYGADYGLFITYRGYQSSGGKWRDEVSGGTVLRVPTGGESASAALVDMRSGEIIWFNPVNGTGASAGDLRDPDRARKTVELLLAAWPDS